MQLRSWIQDQFGSTETLLDESVYSEQDIKEDKIRLRQQRQRILKEMNEYGAEYQRLLEEGAQASEMEAQQYAQQAKIAKKKYKIKQQQYQKNSVQMATVVTVEGARELMSMTETNTTNIEDVLGDDNVDLTNVQEQMMDSMVEYELDMNIMMEVQDALDIDIIGADVDMGSSNKEMEIINQIREGDMEAEQADIDHEVDDQQVEPSLEEDMGISLDEDIGPGI